MSEEEEQHVVAAANNASPLESSPSVQPSLQRPDQALSNGELTSEEAAKPADLALGEIVNNEDSKEVVHESTEEHRDGSPVEHEVADHQAIDNKISNGINSEHSNHELRNRPQLESGRSSSSASTRADIDSPIEAPAPKYDQPPQNQLVSQALTRSNGQSQPSRHSSFDSLYSLSDTAQHVRTQRLVDTRGEADGTTIPPAAPARRTVRIAPVKRDGSVAESDLSDPAANTQFVFSNPRVSRGRRGRSSESPSPSVASWSTSEINPEDSVSRVRRPRTPRTRTYRSSHRSSSGSDAETGFRKFSRRSQYRGLLLCPPDGEHIEGMNERSWKLVKRHQIPLQTRDVYKEAKRRAHDRSALEQYLGLPTNFLREQVEQEIKLFSSEQNQPENRRFRLSFEWSLLGAGVEDSKLMLFLVGTPDPNSNAYEGPNPPYSYAYSPFYMPYGYDDPHYPSAQRQSSSMGRLSPVPSPPPSPRPRADTEASDLRTKAERHRSRTAAPSTVSAYRPAVSIANRYPVSQRTQEDDQASRARTRTLVDEVGPSLVSAMRASTRRNPEIVENTRRVQRKKGAEDTPKSVAFTQLESSNGPQQQTDAHTRATEPQSDSESRNDVASPSLQIDGSSQKAQKKTSSIKFTDCVGRKFTFPWASANTYAGIKSLIDDACVHIDLIGQHVIDGHFDLLGPEDQVILPKLWEDVVEPGWTITQQMWPIPDLDRRKKKSKPPNDFTSWMLGPAPNPGSVAIPPPPPLSEFDPMMTTAHGASTLGGGISLPPPPPPALGVGRVDSGPTPKYVLPAYLAPPPSKPLPRSTYLKTMRSLTSQMPHLTNMLASDCRNPNSGKLSCWDVPRNGGEPILIREAGPQNWVTGGRRVMDDMLDSLTSNVKLRTVIVEDLCPALIECIGNKLWLNPEFFEEHLSLSGYQGAHCSGVPPKTWSSNATTKDYISLKWHRPIYRNELKPHTISERQTLLNLDNEGILEWTTERSSALSFLDSEDDLAVTEVTQHAVSVDGNILRQCWPLVTDPERLVPSEDHHITSVWEERATLYHTKLHGCPLIVILLDPLPTVRHLREDRWDVEPRVDIQPLFKQAYTRNSVGPGSGTASVFTKGPLTRKQITDLRTRIGKTNCTRDDMTQWLREAAQLTPDNPDLSVMTALLWIISRDTIGFLHLVANVLEEIGLGSTDDHLMQTRLAHWRGLISRFQVELSDLRAGLDAFARMAQDLNPVDRQQSIVSEFIPDTLVQIDILIEQNEKSYAALRADMGVLESRKGIAEAESVGKLTELAFIFIPLTFITGAFSMQIEELQTPAPIYAFIIACIITIILAYSLRLVMRSDNAANWTHAHSYRVRKRAGLPPGSKVPTRAFVIYALTYPLPKIVLRLLPSWRALRGTQLLRWTMFLLLVAVFMIPISIVWTHHSLDVGFKVAVTVATLVSVVTVVWFAAGRLIFGAHFSRGLLRRIVHQVVRSSGTSVRSGSSDASYRSSHKRTHSRLARLHLSSTRSSRSSTVTSPGTGARVLDAVKHGALTPLRWIYLRITGQRSKDMLSSPSMTSSEA